MEAAGSSEIWYLPTKLHGITSKKMIIWLLIPIIFWHVYVNESMEKKVGSLVLPTTC
jgi:hypothetical protein